MFTAIIVVLPAVDAFGGTRSAPGMIDRSFGDRGFVYISADEDLGVSTTFDEQERIVSAASMEVSDRTGFDFLVTRHLADGRPDASFGGDGAVTATVGSSRDFAQAVAVDPLGDIVVAGRSGPGLGIIRLNEDGSLDEGFDGDGRLWEQFGYHHFRALGLAIDLQRRIVVVGSAEAEYDTALVVLRLLPDGTPDESFDGDGLALLDFPSSSAEATDVEIDEAGRYVVFGEVWGAQARGVDWIVARYLENGELDAGFADGGHRIISFGWRDTPEGLALDYEGRPVVVGSAGFAGTHVLALARLTTDGHLDPSFSSDGKTTHRWMQEGKSRTFYAAAVTVDVNNEIVVGGSSYGIGAIRFRVNGKLDRAFGGDGIGSARPSQRSVWGTDVLIDSSRRIIVVGGSRLLPEADRRGGVVARFVGQLGSEPSIRINDVRIREGDHGSKKATFKVSLTEATIDDVLVRFETTGESRRSAPRDFAPTSGWLYFTAGEVEKEIDVRVIGDLLDEPTEGFRVELSLAHGARLPDGFATGSILDDGDICTIVGTNGSDKLFGGGRKGRGIGHDVICALRGNDVVEALYGDDLVLGGRGNDRIYGGSGNDKLKGGGGRDLLVGDEGWDRCRGGPGRDRKRTCER